MARRTYEQIFLDKLTYMAGDPPSRVSSKALKEALKWNDNRYDNARAGLIGAGLIRGVVGGPGGSLELLAGATKLSQIVDATPKKAAVDIFVSYSHADNKIKNDLLKHLAPLSRLSLVRHWHDDEIKPGDEWQKAIADKLRSSQIVLLLISSDFISSKYCYEKELDGAMKRHKAKEMAVLPVILRPCLWQDLQFGKLQALPNNGRAITSWGNLDEALTNVATGVREAVQSLQS
ncbi:MAG: toll/interleukin-1 receptor domain-containing protein [bacterium]|nr:toll/interleukin-1 receptor domain-containing protein [bacterium]